jgi:hypothetical protein
MPRIDHRVTPETTLSYEAQMILTLLIQEMNRLRQRASLPPLDAQDVRRAIREYIRTHPRADFRGEG